VAVKAGRATTKALSQLQAVLRAPDHPDAGIVRSGKIPVDLRDRANVEDTTLSLTGDEGAALATTTALVLADPTLEHLGQRKAEQALWRFCCAAHLDRATNHVGGFVQEHARLPQKHQVLFTLRHLSVNDRFEVAGTLVLPLSDVPNALREDFRAEPHVGSVVSVEAIGTDPQRIVGRAREVAEHALRVLRAGLNSTLLYAADRQLRFRIGERHAFADSPRSGWAVADDVAWDLSIGPSEAGTVTDMPMGRLGSVPRNELERRAHTAMRWADNALLITDPIRRMLFLFFALEALVGDKSQKEKGRTIAFRRAMLDHAVRGGFRDPHVTYALYDEVRSAAVHGEEPPAISNREADRFASDVGAAINEFLAYGTTLGATRRGQVMRALDHHADAGAMLDWLRNTDTKGSWASFTP
jgi:hypothetical protein